MKNKRIIVFVGLSLVGLVVGYAFGFLDGNTIKGVVNERVGCVLPNFHYSYFGNKTFFDRAYKNLPEGSFTAKGVKGIVVNHHLLAPHLIAETMSAIATTSEVTVVLISPNHFSAGRGQIISSLYSWDTPYGTLDGDCKTVSTLAKQGVLNIHESPFKKEHGISGIVPFIKKSLPNAKVIPIIVKDTLPARDLDKFVDSLYAILGEDVLIVGSFDFSHVGPDRVAQLNDKKSISVIENFDYKGLKNIEIDSIPGLEIMMRYMEKVGASHFDLIANTNSSQILHDPTIKDATSYIVGTFSLSDKISD